MQRELILTMGVLEIMVWIKYGYKVQSVHIDNLRGV